MPERFGDVLRQEKGNAGAIRILSVLNAKASAIATNPSLRPPVIGPRDPGLRPPIVGPGGPGLRPPFVGPGGPGLHPPRPGGPTPGQPTPPSSGPDPTLQLAASLMAGILTVVVKSLQGELDPDKIDLDQLFVKSPTEMLREQGITQEEIDRIIK